MKKIIAALVLMSALLAQASVTLDWNLYQFQDENGEDLNGVIYVYVDTDGDLWGDPYANDGSSWAVDTDDVLVYTVDSDIGFLTGTDQFNLENGVETGDDVYVIWYADVDSTSSSPGIDTYFGVYNTGVPVPNDGYTITALDGDGNETGVRNYDLSLTADYQTVPEPATVLLALIGGGLAFVVRRRGHKFVS